MDFKDKSESLAAKMNNITAKFTDNLDIAGELDVQGEDIVDFIEAKTIDVELYKETPVAEIINLKNMVDDFKYVRETLKENTQNGRRVLNSVTLDLLTSDDDKRASLIMSFAELNRAVADNMKLYINSYKEISAVLLNLDKIKKNELGEGKGKTPLEGEYKTVVSTYDLIKQLTNHTEN